MRPVDLHVIAVISNSQRYQARYRLYREFAKRMVDAGVTLWTVELAFGARSWSVTEFCNPHHIQLRGGHELWHKENLINIGFSYLPADWQYAAWVDADIGFVRPDWAEETIQQLQHYQVVQLFSRISDLNPEYQSFQTHKGFGWCYHHEKPYRGDCYVGKRSSWHPGFAWAIRRETYDAIGGLYDQAILGSADRYMAHSFIGDVCPFVEGKGFSPALVRSVVSWQDRAYAVVQGSVGYVPGTIYHFWHGSKKNRKYVERWEVLIDNQFDPYRDIRKDANGLWELTGSATLREDVTNYFKQRNEDSIDFE